jgi:hypothetical protein
VATACVLVRKTRDWTDENLVKKPWNLAVYPFNTQLLRQDRALGYKQRHLFHDLRRKGYTTLCYAMPMHS